VTRLDEVTGDATRLAAFATRLRWTAPADIGRMRAFMARMDSTAAGLRRLDAQTSRVAAVLRSLGARSR
jgi:hypothetical protein